MKNLTAIIIEENLENTLKIQQVVEEQCSDITITATCADPIMAKKIIHDSIYDIILLGFTAGINYAFEMLQNTIDDIENKKLILFATEKEQKFQFITNTSIDFISRPFRPENIVKVIKKAKQHFFDKSATQEIIPIQKKPSKPLDLLAIPSIDEVKIIRTNDILYLKSEGKYTSFHVASTDKPIVSSMNLGSYEKKLINNNFFRLHNSFLVNMDHIINVQKRDGVYVKMKNQDVVPVAKRKKDALFQFLGIK